MLGDLLDLVGVSVTISAGLVVGMVGYLFDTITDKVCVLITSTNLPKLIRSALRNSKEKKAQKLLSGVIQSTIQQVKPNQVTIDAFLEDENDDKIRIKLETTEGVDSSLQEGMCIYV